jgi:lactoylglutathione lyase
MTKVVKWMEVGRKIYELRVRSGLSQEALADRLGVTRQSVSKWELGQASPDIEKVIQICHLFNVDTNTILLGSARKNANLRFGMYIIVKDFSKSINFYESLLCLRASIVGKNRFAQLFFDGICIAVMSEAHLEGHDYSGSGDHKFAFNFWTEDLTAEHERVKALGIGEITDIVQAYPSYHFFNVYDPDGNVIEITGPYRSE